MTKKDILKTLQDHQDEIRRFNVKDLALFGSFARDESTESSDMDFVVNFTQKTFDNYMDLKSYLENLFNRRVDLVIADSIKPRLRPQILGGAIHAPGL
jgi:predicted nucleotidyltransferase